MALSGNALDLSLVRRVFQYAKPYKKVFWRAVGLTLLLAMTAPLQPYLLEYTVDHYILVNDMNGLLKMTLLMLGLVIVRAFIQYNHTYCTNWLGQSVIKDIRRDVFNHITSLRLKYFDHTPIGTLITRTVSDLETIADVFSEGLISIVGDLLQIVAILAFMLYINPRLTLIVLTPIPLLLLATYVFKEAIKSAFQDVRQQVTKLNTFLQEHITGMFVTQLFSREEQEMTKFKSINAAHRDANIRSNWYYSIFFPVVELISALSVGLLVWWGAKAILGGDVSPGVVVSFIMYINMLYRPIRELADKFNTLQMGMVSAERVFSVMDTKAFTPNEGRMIPVKTGGGKVDFEDVWFAYNEEQWVLKGISFQIKPGETFALVGATGAGKSSTINILNRFYEIGKGRVMMDGTDIREYELSALRSCIATVLQDVYLFSDTIYNNISLNNPDITKEQMEQAAKDVGADEFIRRLPGGYDYNVQERGATLSSGQAQLISFVRALVYNPSILVLDEATSSVDTETEHLIQNAILKLMDGRTTIVIAHRLSTIRHADKIIVLDKGEIMEMGSHQELLRQNGQYKALYDLQFGGDE